MANDGLPGSAPYRSRMCWGSWPMSITSGAICCMRKAISYELIRVAISGSPTSPSRSWFSLLTASSESRWSSWSTPRGLERYKTGSPLVRNCTPW